MKLAERGQMSRINDLVAGGAATDVGEGAPAAIAKRRRGVDWREKLRAQALASAIAKRAAGAPTYSVPEAAALLSVSQEYLYRLIQADGFPAVRMRLSGWQGRYVVPAKAVEQLLDVASTNGLCVEMTDAVAEWDEEISDGAGAAR
jgi:excisionase family DNA binding protein